LFFFFFFFFFTRFHRLRQFIVKYTILFVIPSLGDK
jgi:hypothetical protein